MVPQQQHQHQHQHQQLPHYRPCPQPSFPQGAGSGLPQRPPHYSLNSNAGPGFPQHQGLAVQVGIPVGVSPMPFQPPTPQQPSANVSATSAFSAMPHHMVAPTQINPMQHGAANGIASVHHSNIQYGAANGNGHMQHGAANGIAPVHLSNPHIPAPHHGDVRSQWQPLNPHIPSTTGHVDHPNQWQGAPPLPFNSQEASFQPPTASGGWSSLQMPKQNMVIGSQGGHHAFSGTPNQCMHPQAPGHTFSQQNIPGQYGQIPPLASNAQVSDAGGTVMGFPATGTPAYLDGPHGVSPAMMPGQPPVQAMAYQGHQPFHPSQSICNGNPTMNETPPQVSKSTFAYTKYYRGQSPHSQSPHSFRQTNVEPQNISNGWPPPKFLRGDSMQSTPLGGHQSTPGLSPAATDNNPFYSGRPQEPFQADRREDSHGKGARTRVSLPSDSHYLAQSSNVHKKENQKVVSPDEHSRLNRDNAPLSTNGCQRTIQLCQSGSKEEDKFKGACVRQDSRSTSYKQEPVFQSKEVRGRQSPMFNARDGRLAGQIPDKKLLRCDPCERTFTSIANFEAHSSSHVKCDEEGCNFEASGKIVKEHMVTEHKKVVAPTTSSGCKALALRSKESQEDIARWLQERRSSYPTRANVLRKMEETKLRKGRKDNLNEESKKRCQRLREVLQKQKELGVLVADVPNSYLRPERRGNTELMTMVGSKRTHPMGEGVMPDETKPCDVKPNDLDLLLEEPSLKLSKVANDSKDAEPQHSLTSQGTESQCQIDEIHVPKNFQKRRRNQRAPRKDTRRNCGQGETNSAKIRQPSLLSKLLEPNIKKERSMLLQCCRFFANNSFLVAWPSSPLKHFDWIEGGTDAAMPLGSLHSTNAGSAQEACDELNELTCNPQHSTNEGGSVSAEHDESKILNSTVGCIGEGTPGAKHMVEKAVQDIMLRENGGAHESSCMETVSKPDNSTPKVFAVDALVADTPTLPLPLLYNGHMPKIWKGFGHDHAISDVSESLLNEDVEGVSLDSNDMSEEPFDVNLLFADSTDVPMVLDSK